MRLFQQFLGFFLFISGIYLIGKDIVFTTQASYYWWQAIPAAGSVLAFLSGLWILFTARSSNHFIGWILIGVGIVAVFMSSGIVLRPVTLWTFLLAFSLLIGGLKLMSPKRLRF